MEKAIELRAYKMVDLSDRKNWPDGVHYETVRSRVESQKHVIMSFQTWSKILKENVLYLDYATSLKIKKAFELYDLYTKWKIFYK